MANFGKRSLNRNAKKPIFALKNKQMQQMVVTKTGDDYLIKIPGEANTDEVFFSELRFRILAEKWKEQSRFFSFAQDRFRSEVYEEILKMGPDVLPFIVRDLEQSPGWWFHALKTLSGENPVPKEHQGNIHLMTQDWLQWAKRHLR